MGTRQIANLRKRPFPWLMVGYYCLFLTYFLYASWFIQNGFHMTGITWVDPYAIESMARNLLSGDLDIYRARVHLDFAPPDGVAIQYGPLPVIIMAPFIMIGDFFHLMEYRDFLLRLPFILFDFVCVVEVARILRHRFAVEKKNEFLAVFILLFSPLFFSASVINGKFESMMALFVLKAIDVLREKPLRSGVWMGLALASKTYALIACIPIGLLLLCEGVRTGHLKNLVKFVGSAVVTFGILMSPFIIANIDNVFFAFVVSPNRYGIGGQTLMGHVLRIIRVSGRTRNILATNANAVTLGAVTIYSAVMSWRLRNVYSTQMLYVLIACPLFLFIPLAKFSWLYYGVIPLVLTCVWDFASSGNHLPYFSFALCILLFFVVGYFPESHREVGGALVYLVAVVALSFFLWRTPEAPSQGV